jgi:hypothetical protein
MGNRLLDASTTLLGWINHTATDQNERVIAAGTAVKLNTPLDAAGTFTFLANHPGHTDAVTYTLELAPELRDGTVGTWFEVAAVAIPAAGGKVETTISGHDLQPDPADAESAVPPCFRLARAVVSPDTPEGMFVGLTAFHGL